MGGPASAPPRLCGRLLPLLPLGLFIFLLSFYSLRLPELPLSACVRGGRPCRWFGETPPDKEGPEKLPPVSTPTRAHDAPTKVHDAPSLQIVCTQSSQGSSFRIHDMLSAFTTSITPSREILIREYLQGWKELIKFMDSLGAAFGLISGETQSKISIMEHHQKGRHNSHYRTLQAMVDFELASGLVGFQSLPPSRPPSGCRTLLRLHRALKWLELFLHKLGASREEEGGDPSQMCADAYQATLAPYHSWWVRQAAALAFLALPSRQELYRIICNQEERQAHAVLLTTVRSLARVYNITQEVYATHGMLDLP